jgi:hypothetical protein
MKRVAPVPISIFTLNKITVYLQLQCEELALLNCKEKAQFPIQTVSPSDFQSVCVRWSNA